MQLTKEKRGECSILMVHGRLDGTTSPKFETEVLGWLGAGGKAFVLDMAGISFMSSAALRVLLSMAKRVARTGGKVVLSSPNSVVSEVFEISNFSAMFTICPTLDEGVHAATQNLAADAPAAPPAVSAPVPPSTPAPVPPPAVAPPAPAPAAPPPAAAKPEPAPVPPTPPPAPVIPPPVVEPPAPPTEAIKLEPAPTTVKPPAEPAAVTPPVPTTPPVAPAPVAPPTPPPAPVKAEEPRPTPPSPSAISEAAPTMLMPVTSAPTVPVPAAPTPKPAAAIAPPPVPASPAPPAPSPSPAPAAAAPAVKKTGPRKLELVAGTHVVEIRDGDVIGTEGSVATHLFKSAPSLQPRHILIGKSSDSWFVMIPRNVQVVTHLDGAVLVPGVRQDLHNEHQLSIGDFAFSLRLSEAPARSVNESFFKRLFKLLNRG